MCDTLIERITGAATADHPGPVELQVVMTDATLLGSSQAPADLVGYGPIPADLARQLTGSSRTWIRRLLTDPFDGTVTNIDTRRRRFHGPLRDLIGIRDRRCRNPVCNAPIRDHDHRTDHAHGGPTNAANGNGYCRRCHHLKDHPAITVTELERLHDRAQPAQSDAPYGTVAAHGIVWTGPSGNTYPSLAPPALGTGRLTLTQLRRRRQLLDASSVTERPTDDVPELLENDWGRAFADS
jgi:hypothetical protein